MGIRTWGRRHQSRAADYCRLAVAIGVAVVLAPGAGAQTGQLAITVNVQPSISLVFMNNANVGNPGYCPLTNAGTNNVGLDLGRADFPSGTDDRPCVQMIKGFPTGAYYQVASAFDVVVTKANSSSGSYNLTAQISVAPPANVAWLLDGVALSTAPAAVGSYPYTTRATKALQVQVRNTVPAGSLQETVTFVATAN